MTKLGQKARPKLLSVTRKVLEVNVLHAIMESTVPMRIEKGFQHLGDPSFVLDREISLPGCLAELFGIAVYSAADEE